MLEVIPRPPLPPDGVADEVLDVPVAPFPPDPPPPPPPLGEEDPRFPPEARSALRAELFLRLVAEEPPTPFVAMLSPAPPPMDSIFETIELWPAACLIPP